MKSINYIILLCGLTLSNAGYAAPVCEQFMQAVFKYGDNHLYSDGDDSHDPQDAVYTLWYDYPDNQPFAMIFHKKSPEICYDDKVISSISLNDSNTEYLVNGIVIAKVSRKKNRIKVKSKDDHLLWQVEMNKDNIKIANNSAMNMPYLINCTGLYNVCSVFSHKTKIGDGVYENSELLLRFLGDNKVKKDDEFDYLLSGRFRHVSYSLLLDEIPVELRLIISAEATLHYP